MRANESAPVVLVVDDEPATRRGLRALLEMGGFRVAEADSVASAREALGLVEPTFVVLDLRLPDGSGLDVLSAIRDLERTSRPFVYMFTGFGSVDAGLEAVRRGVDEFMQKDDGGARLLDTIWRAARWLEDWSDEVPRGSA